MTIPRFDQMALQQLVHCPLALAVGQQMVGCFVRAGMCYVGTGHDAAAKAIFGKQLEMR